jgi:type II secretory pathway pseudopilin PulG
MLLFLMLAVAVLTITMLGVARNYRRSIVRDREVEMIHRGEQYERAVKRFYKKNGRYPASIEQLEDFNKVRYLRKRYKDPMSPDGAWQLVHITDLAKLKIGGLPGMPGTGAGSGSANPSQANAGSLSSSDSGGSGRSAPGDAAQGASGTTQGPGGTTAGAAGSGDTSSAAGGSPGTAGGTTNASQGAGGTTGGATTGGTTGDASSTGAGSSNPANGGVLGGGDVYGVVSKMKAEGIHSFGDKTKYNEWFFIYVPAQDTGKGLLSGPYNPKMFLGAATAGVGNSDKGSGASGTVGGGTPNTAAPGTVAAPSTPAPAAPQ